MRLGLMFGGIDLSLTEMAAVGREAEEIGMNGLYCVEAYRSGLLPLAALAYATEHVTIGPYVLNAYCRTPFAAGLSALDLDEMSGGRLAMAIGSGNVHVTRQWMGTAHTTPLAKMRDYFSILRHMMRARQGDRVSYSGDVHSIDWVQQAYGPAGRPVPLYMAAIFPKMLKLAGAVADGIALGAMTGPSYIRDLIVPSARSAAKEAGRDPDALGYKMCTMVAVDEDRDVARKRAREAVAGTFVAHPHPYYEHMLREQGFGTQLDHCLTAVAAGDFTAAANAISDDVIDTVTIWGTPEDCATRLASYEGIIDEVVCANVRPRSKIDSSNPLAAYRPLFETVKCFLRRSADSRAGC